MTTIPTSKSYTRLYRIPLSVMLAILVSASWAITEGYAADCYVISAGVDNYPRANKLQGCLNDARNTTAAYKSQEGLMFQKVYAYTLLDGEATSGNINQKLQTISRLGKKGDSVVIFLSGHGSRQNNGWFFLTYDYNPQNQMSTVLTDRYLLNTAQSMVSQGKKVFIIIDACFSGQVQIIAREYYPRLQKSNGGGLILMLSSSASQTSNALGNYSAFAKAFADGMLGGADLNGDRKITLKEVEKYSYKRTHDLIQQRGLQSKQDSEMGWSPTISGNLVLAMTKNQTTTQTQTQTTTQRPRRWVGSENLPGYGTLAFELFGGGRVVMTDAKGVSEGTWRQNGQLVTLQFRNGQVV